MALSASRGQSPNLPSQGNHYTFLGSRVQPKGQPHYHLPGPSLGGFNQNARTIIFPRNSFYDGRRKGMISLTNLTAHFLYICLHYRLRAIVDRAMGGYTIPNPLLQ